MSNQNVSGFVPPRIYCVSPASIAQRGGWEALLARVSAMQFDAVLLACPTVVLPSEAASSTANNDNDQLISAFAQACTDAGLRLLLDLEIDRFPPEHDFVTQHMGRFFLNEKDEPALPDPRCADKGSYVQRAQLRLDAAGTQAALDYWGARLTAWLAGGASGFRCLGIARIPPTLWRALIAQGKSVRADAVFLAWTPGCTPEQLAAIRDCGFDAVFSSDAWWDFRAGWFAEEHRRLAALAAIITAPEDPLGPRLRQALRLENPEAINRAYRRAVLAAAVAGDGILITEGFEFGADTALADLHQDKRRPKHPSFDLSMEIADLNRRIAERRRLPRSSLHVLSSPAAEVALLLRQTGNAQNASATLAVINANLELPQVIPGRLIRECAAGWTLAQAADDGVIADTAARSDIRDDSALMLQPGSVLFYQMHTVKPIVLPVNGGKPAVVRAASIARIAIEQVTPSVDGGRFPVKRVAGRATDIEADIFSDGHDLLAAAVLWRAVDDKTWREVSMQAIANDRWRAVLPLERIGRHLFVIEAWRDGFATYRNELDKKVHAGLNVTLEVQEGCLLIDKLIAGHATESPHVEALKRLRKKLPAKSKKKSGGDQATAVALLLATETLQLIHKLSLREFATRSSCEFKIDVERKAVEFASWYELFPRSQSGDETRHGTFDDVIKRLPAVHEMGFDTLYFPPIHPIGNENRKGRNNSLTPSPGDPGSPYAIGSEAGGHDAIHPELGTLQDFRRLLAAAAEHGMEIALDFAIQCSPDHPWLTEHPEWFAWQSDGSIRHAENPPKKYEDIVNVDFYADGAIPDLWIALRDVVLMWMREGVRVFRVDNPHTKPLPFWEWLIGDVRSRFPDTIFLAEAFTRPKPMYRLAKLGFSQSYTYFTWRHGKQEFIDYLTELTAEAPAGGPREFFRPHFFVNTPDINPYFLQHSGRPGFLIRAALAATLSGLWGVYSGFELCEAQAVTGKEEYLHSEKYEIRAWDWHRPGNIVREITLLNRIRKGNPALQTHLGVRFQYSSSEQILYFSKATRDLHGDDHRFGDNVLLIAINLDPFSAHDATIELPLWQFGLPDHATLEVEELMSESRFTWHGKQQQIHLDPQQLPFAIWRVRPLKNQP